MRIHQLREHVPDEVAPFVPRPRRHDDTHISVLLVAVAVALALLVMLLLNGCPPTPGPQPPPGPVDASNATPCQEACDRLVELKCEEAKPTPEGTSCEEVCENAVAEGMPINTDCVAHIAKCSDLGTVCR